MPRESVIRGNTEEVQGHGNFDVFEELFAYDFDFVDQTAASLYIRSAKDFFARKRSFVKVAAEAAHQTFQIQI